MNYNKTILNKVYYQDILFPYIEKIAGEKLTFDQKTYIIQKLKSIHPERLVGLDTRNFTELMSKKLAKEVFTAQFTKDDDPREKMTAILKDFSTDTVDNPSQNDILNKIPEVMSGNSYAIKSFLGTSKLGALLDEFREVSKDKIIYVVFDSKYRDTNAPANKFRWTYVNTPDTRQGTVNNIYTIQNITKIKIQPFRLPYQPDFINNFKRITIFIEELFVQSYLCHENRRFHFICRTEDTTPMITLNPYEMSDGVFEFNTPIAVLNTFTLSFANPLQIMNFASDRFKASGAYGSPTIISTASDHGLTTGEYIVLEEFPAASLTTDQVQVLSQLTVKRGLVATVLTSTTVSVAIDSSGLIGTGVLSAFTVYCQSRRFFIPAEIHVQPDSE
jgi:hypothetical protein